MNIFVTLDYELFFGNSGTPEKCIIEPTNKLIEIANKYNFKCVFFVDSGYLIKLKEFKEKHPNLEKDFNLVSNQIKELSDNGHDIQLHIHPHWEDTTYDENGWNFDLKRYRLDAFSESGILDIFFRYKNILEEIISKKINTYRAGGWCIQPFEKLKNAFIECDLKIDSTVFYNGKNTTQTQWFDFESAKDLDHWRFSNDPCVEDEKGPFLEIPIASTKVFPLFFWKFAVIKKIGLEKHKPYGDGSASPTSNLQIKRLLTKPSHSVVSMDGYKASLLNKAYKMYSKDNKQNFVIIGHPKAFTNFSLNKFDLFMRDKLRRNNAVKIFSEF
ncbi:hypothetical protein ES677_04780 [Bizionia gelidisalsuginis]|uniref:NodB homology domain-containing protein n=1 Tax=Bizionia gelidisalsuginis TaxID=291188 RepID=A0ABY3MCP7_9FLAO|nr:hypothetical protein [Bizionia gelidisalsuginis]TYC15660.1 hypothetical protein ES677_04780 [Bizionia gelidisalsuginis]